MKKKTVAEIKRTILQQAKWWVEDYRTGTLSSFAKIPPAWLGDLVDALIKAELRDLRAGREERK